jgi:hypothetical protein
MALVRPSSDRTAPRISGLNNFIIDFSPYSFVRLNSPLKQEDFPTQILTIAEISLSKTFVCCKVTRHALHPN